MGAVTNPDPNTTEEPTLTTRTPWPSSAAPTPPPNEPPPPGGAPGWTTPPPSPPPAWRPPPADRGRNGSLVFGAILLAVGLWFFATRTLGLDLPDLDWGRLWPIILIVIGGWVVLNSARQRR